MQVREWMSPDPLTVNRSAAVTEARDLIRARGIHHLPIVDGRKQLVGMVSDRDVLAGAANNGDDTDTVGSIMSHPVHTVTGSASIAEAARAMLSRRINALPVVDDGQLVGLVTSSDCLLALLETDLPETELPGTDPAERVTGGQLRDLSVDECMAFLVHAQLGRLGFTRDDRPEVLPLNYRWHAGAVILRVGYGSLLEDIGLHQVAFEVDSGESVPRWSVVLHGRAEEVWAAEEIAELDALALRPWAGGQRDHYVRIIPSSMTGRIVE